MVPDGGGKKGRRRRERINEAPGGVMEGKKKEKEGASLRRRMEKGVDQQFIEVKGDGKTHASSLRSPRKRGRSLGPSPRKKHQFISRLRKKKRIH